MTELQADLIEHLGRPMTRREENAVHVTLALIREMVSHIHVKRSQLREQKHDLDCEIETAKQKIENLSMRLFAQDWEQSHWRS